MLGLEAQQQYLSYRAMLVAIVQKLFGALDGPAIRNANRGDSRESIHRTINPIFITCELKTANRLKPAIRNVLAP